jgi:hypothetical protein
VKFRKVYRSSVTIPLEDLIDGRESVFTVVNRDTEIPV